MTFKATPFEGSPHSPTAAIISPEATAAEEFASWDLASQDRRPRRPTAGPCSEAQPQCRERCRRSGATLSPPCARKRWCAALSGRTRSRDVSAERIGKGDRLGLHGEIEQNTMPVGAKV